MLEKLKKQLDAKGYIYSETEGKIYVEFSRFSAIYNIFEEKYSIYIFNNNNEIIAHKNLKQVKRAIDYILNF